LRDCDVGIEVTEAIPAQYAKYSAIAEQEFPNASLDSGHFRLDRPKMTTRKMRDLLKQDQLTSPPWVGSRPEQEWARHIAKAFDTKLIKLAKPGFGIHQQNWLAIYDNLPLPNVHLGNAISYLVPLIQDYWSRCPCFDTLFIEHGPVIAKIT
jgi:hypothetical protein